MTYKTEKRLLLAIVLIVFVALGISPKADRFTWFLENSPVLLGFAVLLVTERYFTFSRLVYRVMCLHAIILMVGGHWTYAEVPLGNWVRDAFGLARNHYDRLGHFAQGFFPAVIVREVLLRFTPLRPGGWLSMLVVSVCLALSAVYEFVEWWVSLATGEAAAAFLGTQGDVWDTQWDMFLCTIGAILSLLLLSRYHDKSMAEAIGKSS